MFGGFDYWCRHHETRHVLVCLVANPGEVTERENILNTVWGSRAVLDEPLTRCIATLRKALGDDPHDSAYIRTVPKRGYRLVAAVDTGTRRGPDFRSGGVWRRAFAAAAIVATAIFVLWLNVRPWDMADSRDVADIAVLPAAGESLCYTQTDKKRAERPEEGEMKTLSGVVLCASLLIVAVATHGHPRDKHPRGLDPQARAELEAAGVTKYVGQFTPAVSAPAGDGWIKHTFDPDSGDGPMCIAGTEYSVFTKRQNPAKLLIMLQGGGACWQGFYFCNVLAESQEPPPPPVGIWDDVSGLNPIDNWSVVYLPYCDGSVFSGDNDVFDPAFGTAIGAPQAVVRFHRGLRNATAGIDLAKAMFPRASRILVAGTSAGGVGAAGFSPFLARMAYGNNKKLMVFNDAGPVAINLADTGAIAARAADWDFGQFYPASCSACSDMGQGTEIIKWRLENDNTIREAFYSTDFDETNRFFMGLLADPLAYRNLVISEHGEINALYPDRYKRFIQANRTSHTALQEPEFYTAADGVPLYEWLDNFVKPTPHWTDIVEELQLE